MNYNNYKNILEQKSQLKRIIYNNGKKITYQKNEIILKKNDILQYVYYLDKGRVMYTTFDENGKYLILKTENRSILIGAIPILQGHDIVEANVISETKSEIYAINLDTFFSLFHSSITFQYYLLNYLSSSMINEGNKNIVSKLSTNKDILYSYFVENINYEQSFDNCWYSIYPQYSQQKYADFLGVSRMTITTILKKLREEGKIRLINHEIQVRIINEDIVKLSLN